MTNTTFNRKKIIRILIIFCTLSFLIIAIFMSNKKYVDLVIDERINISELGIEIQLKENILLSYNTYELIPYDSTKLRLMFENNHHTEKLQLSMKTNDCIWFKLTDKESSSNDVMVFINPITKENWFYNFMNSDIIYTADLSDEDIDYIIDIEEKYSLLAKQMTTNKGSLKLEHKEKENDWILYTLKLDYPDTTISELYYKIKYKGAGESRARLSESAYNDDYFNVKIYDDEYNAKELIVIIRGFEMIKEEEIPFQNIYRFQKKDLQ